jgi:hypothetical protein
MNSSAAPSCPSVTPAWSRIAGIDAPQAPQNAPKAAKPPSTRTRPPAASPTSTIPALCQRRTAGVVSVRR